MNSGGCFCGAVQFTVTGALTGVTYCHCSKCRRWHGHAGAYTAVERAELLLTETRGLAWHAVSPTVRRAFCSVCGSSLLFDDSGDPKVGICAGAIDAPTGLRETAHIFVASKGDYYEVPPGLPAFETIPQRAPSPAASAGSR